MATPTCRRPIEPIWSPARRFDRSCGGVAGDVQDFGDTHANPMGIRLSFILASAMGIASAAVFLGYRLGNTPEETCQNLGLSESARG